MNAATKTKITNDVLDALRAIVSNNSLNSADSLTTDWGFTPASLKTLQLPFNKIIKKHNGKLLTLKQCSGFTTVNSAINTVIKACP